jgi:hypothetical protein
MHSRVKAFLWHHFEAEIANICLSPALPENRDDVARCMPLTSMGIFAVLKLLTTVKEFTANRCPNS